MPATAVFDTNILFSAVGWRGNPFHVVELARSGKIKAIACAGIMDDLAEKLATKLNFSSDQVADALADYLAFIPVIPIPGTLKGKVRDPDDNAVLECAITGKASFIITGDLDLLVLGSFEGIEILRAAEFFRRWEAGKLPS